MLPIEDSIPNFASNGRYFYDYAVVLLDFHNAMLDILDSDEDTRYSTVLKFDRELRAICAEKVPSFLAARTPPEPTWPKWVLFARTLQQASVNHKIIMLHQAFLKQSVRNARVRTAYGTDTDCIHDHPVQRRAFHVHKMGGDNRCKEHHQPLRCERPRRATMVGRASFCRNVSPMSRPGSISSI
jgi:hypothetical protein